MLDYCIRMARALPKPPRGKHRIYAVCTDRKGRIVGESANLPDKSHPFQKYCAERSTNPHREFLHAEVGSIIKSKGKAVNLFVARVGRSGEVLPCCPCDSCQIAISLSGIKSVTYTL